MANSSQSALLNKLYKEFELNQDDIFKSPQGFVILVRSAIEKIQYKLDIKIKYEYIRCERDWVVMKAFAEGNGKSLETTASAILGEYKMVTKSGKNGSYQKRELVGGNTAQWYLTELCEKRALSRAVLKIADLYQYQVFSEDESVAFNQSAEERKRTSQELANTLANDIAKKF